MFIGDDRRAAIDLTCEGGKIKYSYNAEEGVVSWMNDRGTSWRKRTKLHKGLRNWIYTGRGVTEGRWGWRPEPIREHGKNSMTRGGACSHGKIEKTDQP